MYRIMRKINLVSRCQGSFMAKRLKGLGLGPCHHGYLLTVARRPGISQEELAGTMCVNKSSVTRTLAALEELGYVERSSAPQDRRVLQVFPTEKLRRALPEIRLAAKTWNAYLTADFTDEELDQFQRCLDKIVRRAEDYAQRGEEAME